jgi:hypothetical protein
MEDAEPSSPATRYHATAGDLQVAVCITSPLLSNNGHGWPKTTFDYGPGFVGLALTRNVTNALLLSKSTCDQIVVHFINIMKSTTPTRIRIRRFITDRYAYRTKPDCLPELVAFGIIVLISFGPIFVLASAMAGTLK